MTSWTRSAAFPSTRKEARLIAFLLLLASAFCFLLVLFHAHTGVDLSTLGHVLLALGLALGAYVGPRPWNQ